MRPSILRITMLSVLASAVLVPVTLSRLISPPPLAQAQSTAQAKPAPSEDRVGYPEGYESWQQLFVFDRPDNRSVRVIYGNAEAAAANPAAPPNQVFPYGSILVMETWRAKMDANGSPELDANGRFQRDQLTNIFVERKEPGFGEAYQVARAGEWEWVAFRPDRSYSTTPQDSHPCALCHQDAGATRDWVMRANLYFAGMSGAVPFAGIGAAAVGRLSIDSYTFLPGTATVPLGTTVTWGNEDPIAHTVTADDRSFDSGRLGPGQTFSFTFSQPGTIEYLCTLHQNMKARLIVE
jgi:plastocyanin